MNEHKAKKFETEESRKSTGVSSAKPQCQGCECCLLTVQKYEHYCYNCDRYEPIDSDSGWCGNTKVSATSWCSSWK